MTDVELNRSLSLLLEESVEDATIRERTTFDNLSAPFGDQVVLHGAGALGRNVLNALRANGIEPLAFSDGSPAKWGTEISGIQVLSPEEAANHYGRNAVFVVTISARGGDFLPLARLFTELGCVKVIPFRCLFWKYPDQVPPHLLYDIPSKVLSAKEDIVRAYKLLSDTASRVEFLAQLRWRLHQDFEILTTPCGGEQYFPAELFNLTGEEVFVDTGAFDGDTLRVFLDKTATFEKYIALEPDPGNFGALQAFVTALPGSISNRITPVMACAGDRKERLRFSTGAGDASRLSADGDIEVECDTLDNLLVGLRPTFIKMDIEGAEPAALRGARRLLADGHAIWAVCVYHESKHLWEIPLIMADSSEDYRFFIRKYVGEVWETVCYAVPLKRLCKKDDAVF